MDYKNVIDKQIELLQQLQQDTLSDKHNNPVNKAELCTRIAEVIMKLVDFSRV